jgi:hypothetical protein
MSLKCPSNNKVTFKITVERVIDQMMILKATSLFNGHSMHTYMTYIIIHHITNTS